MNLFKDIQKCFDNKINDAPLAFKPNVNNTSLKSNVENVKSYPNNQLHISSLDSNIVSIEADRKEWHDYYNKGIFNDYPNLKSICKKACQDYIKILNKLSNNKNIPSALSNRINRCILNLNADLTNIF